jgi:hypothetical protein
MQPHQQPWHEANAYRGLRVSPSVCPNIISPELLNKFRLNSLLGRKLKVVG